MLKKLKNFVLYADLSPEAFQSIMPDLLESNRKNLVTFNILVVVGMLAMTTLTLFWDDLAVNRWLYFSCAILGGILLAISTGPAKRHRGVVLPCVYIFAGLMFTFGIVMGTVLNPDLITSSYLVMMFAVPLLFTDCPLRMSMAVVISNLIYLTASLVTQQGEVLAANMTNVLAYGTVSIVITCYMMKIKVQRLAYEQENRFLSESDQLTGLLNRRSYDRHLQKLQESTPDTPVTICAFDVNGLKTVNDTLGHRAGDELICGAARCIENAFGPYGICYRTGGDEFMAILSGLSPSAEELRLALEKQTHSWKGMLVSGVSLSLGIAFRENGEALEELVQRADKAMYSNKSEYYRSSGIDRRRRS